MSKRKARNEDGCRCGTGSYCHKHQCYETSRTNGTAYDDRSLDQEALTTLSRDERCGGGRRVLRGGFSANNRQW